MSEPRFDHLVAIEMQQPTVDTLDEIVQVLGSWQRDGAPIQLHPGDLGWHWRLGAEALAESLRLWRRDGEMLAVGFVDKSGLVRMGVAPSADDDDQLAGQLVTDVSDPARGVLPGEVGIVEARCGSAFRALLSDRGFVADEPWTPLQRNLSASVEDCGMRIVTVGPDQVEARVEVQRAAFVTSVFTVEQWHTMAEASPYRLARCLVGYDDQDTAVAAVTVWSAGPGRPGLLEPMGVHRDHRGRGYGTAITVAAAAALRDLGSSSALVCTPSSNTGGVATYVKAGFEQLPDVTDFRRGQAAPA